MGSGAAVIAAAQRPDLVTSLVLVGPFVRKPRMNPALKVLMRIATAPAWAAPVWKSYLPNLYAGRKADDQASFAAQANAAMRRKGYAAAFSKTTHTSHDPAEAALDDVEAPVLVVMGELDPDFAKPADEAAWIAERLHGEVLMVPDAGHYPQSQQPELVGPAIASFLAAHASDGNRA